MKIRTETGVTLAEYRQKCGDISDAIAAAEEPPDEVCKQVLQSLRAAMEGYAAAQEDWAAELRAKVAADESRRLAENRDNKRFGIEELRQEIYETAKAEHQSLVQARLSHWVAAEKHLMAALEHVKSAEAQR